MTWAPDVTLIPLEDIISLQVFDEEYPDRLAKYSDNTSGAELYKRYQEGIYTPRKIFTCSRCSAAPAFYTTYWYVTGMRGRSKESVKLACPKHAASFAKNHVLGIEARKGVTQYPYRLSTSPESIAKMVQRYEERWGHKLPEVDGKKVLPGEIDVVLAVYEDPKQRLQAAMHEWTTLTVTSEDVDRWRAGKAPRIHLHPQAIRAVRDAGMITQFEEISVALGVEFKHTHLMLTAKGKALAERVRQEFGAGIP